MSWCASEEGAPPALKLLFISELCERHSALVSSILSATTRPQLSQTVSPEAGSIINLPLLQEEHLIIINFVTYYAEDWCDDLVFSTNYIKTIYKFANLLYR
jgi:hypothetical protein